MGRFVTGFGVGACSLLSAPRQVRGQCSYQLLVILGIFVTYCINFGTESMANSGFPRYDYRHGRIDQARSTMSKLYGLSEIEDQLEAESASKGGWHGWAEIFQGPRMPYRIFLGIVLQALQQLTGANYFFYYDTVVFNGAGIRDTYVTQMILGVVNFGTTFGGLYVIEYFGRRKSLITGGIWLSYTPGAGKAMVVFACPMVWAIGAELYPSRYRATAMALATASNWLWNFLIGFFTPLITGDIDFAHGYVFTGCLFAGVVIVYFCVLEGKGKTLEEMDMIAPDYYGASSGPEDSSGD
ncbi:uncharacterized protein P174DRAFT_463037 [Aspergillus novofumigatus IBT 16806]|uniref:MFS monosaccharide transporter n=1 Tax=Aspergillus novofumigatus (strain IBT 16806) TaxID=1392255 RepID=A0A2I1BZU9_ASPN1|nr:uncharacterized protein P174DRAFT_463037 [Aspergillus novofumigatus IBT 16806]PKX90871.1 hypothetical protein P174DRAFT_463037 [Aspergillus novofumigatus IBT 16806]